jgi:hypothetical protein
MPHRIGQHEKRGFEMFGFYVLLTWGYIYLTGTYRIYEVHLIVKTTNEQ